MSYSLENRKNKIVKQKEGLKTHSIRKYIKNDKWMLLRDIRKALDLREDQSNFILSKIMQGFWKGEHNLYSLPHFSKIFTELGCKKHHLIILNREMLRSILLSEITGKKRTQKRIDLITNSLEFADGKDAFYKTFVKEDWTFYLRIINRIKRNYRNKCKQKSAENKRQLDNQEKLALASPNYIKLYTLDVLSIEITYFIQTMKFILSKTSYCFDEAKIKNLEHIFDCLNQCIDQQKIRKGHQLSNEFLLLEYMDMQQEEINKTGSPKTIEEIAQEIYIKYYKNQKEIDVGNGTRRLVQKSKINSPKSVKSRIYEQIKKEVSKTTMLMCTKYNMTSERIIEECSKYFYISQECIKDNVLAQTGECLNMKFAWLELAPNTHELVKTNTGSEHLEQTFKED
jgi:hypothetical protein